MKTLSCTLGLKRHTGQLLTFMLILAFIIMAFVPVSNSVVYGEETLTEGGVSTIKWTVKFIDIDGTVLKTEEVDDGGDATPPTIKAKKGYKFLGWSDWYVNITQDTTVRAVYDLVMTTSTEEEGELGATGTANPPAEKIAVATTGGLEVIDTSEAGITTPEVIKNNPTPTTVVETPTDEGTLSPTIIILIVLGAIIVLAIATYLIIMYRRKKRKEEYTS